jgi:hypothetical protein
METKIYKKTSTLICLFLLVIYHAQCKRLNILIMIDEKPCLTVNNFSINIPPSIEKNKFKYIVGSVDVNDNFYLGLLNSSSQNVNINFGAIIPDKVFISKYSISIPKIYLSEEYIIISIYNLDNKKYRNKYTKLVKDSKEYYVVIKTPNSMKFD